MQTLMSVSVALFAGLMMTRLFKVLKLGFPDVTAFLIAGLIVGPFGLGLAKVPGLGFSSFEEVESVHIVVDAALGFIAFSIGSEFKLAHLKTIGRKATVTAILGAVGATVLVDAALIALWLIFGSDTVPLPVAITLGAIASATAPAATLMVVKQYKAKGPVTEMLLPIVAIDDAVGLVIFAVSFGVAQALGGGKPDLINVVTEPILQIVCSFILGAVMGYIMSLLEKTFRSGRNRMAVTIAFVLFTIAVSSIKIPIGPVTVSFSNLLVLMMMGMVFCNASDFSEDIFYRSDRWTAPLFAAFFVLSGAELDLSVLMKLNVVLIGVVYVLVRMAGKYLGALLGCVMTGCEPKVKKYLGITLFPQAGVALGMTVTAVTLGGEEAVMIRNIVLFGVLLYELFGPALTKWALTAAGDIQAKPADSRRFDRTGKEIVK